MKRKTPGNDCFLCGRLKDGNFTLACNRCMNRYTRSYAEKTYEYRGLLLTATEWARIIGYTQRAMHYHLSAKHRTVEEVIARTRRKGAIDARLDRMFGRTDEAN